METALTFGKKTLLQVAKQAVEEDAGQDLACYGQKGDSTVAVAGLAVSFALVNVDGCGIPEFLWQLVLVPHCFVQSFQLVSDGRTTGLVNLSRNGVGPGAFPLVICLIALLTSSLEGGISRYWFAASCGRRAMASSLIAAGRLSTMLKCSAHLSRICFLSEIRVEPSALSRGEDPEDCGP